MIKNIIFGSIINFSVYFLYINTETNNRRRIFVHIINNCKRAYVVTYVSFKMYEKKQKCEL